MSNEHLNIVFVGHVDHGKSTIIGRLLAETNALPKGKLEKIKYFCESNSKPFEYAFLLDALSDEQIQGITIDIARCFFNANNRNYLLLDAPGHIEFLKNLVTGAADAEAAFLIIDAQEGVQENTRRHAYMLSFLNVKQIVVLINKMDLINYDQDKFNKIKQEFSAYLKQIHLDPIDYIPLSGREGDNIVEQSKKIPWYSGSTVLGALDKFKHKCSNEDQTFRMHIQDVYKFTKDGDNRRIFAGLISSGTLKIGDRIMFHPSGKISTVKKIEAFNNDALPYVKTGFSIGFTLHDHVYAKRGDVISIVNEFPPIIASILKVSLFWLGVQPLNLKKVYWFKVGTSKTKMIVEKINYVLDTFSLDRTDNVDKVKANQVAECIFRLFTPVAYDNTQANPTMRRFIIVDDYNISGGGIIQDHIEDNKTKLQKHLYQRNIKWIASGISLEEREKKFNQQSQLILITGDCASKLRKEIAVALEKFLFVKGKFVYLTGIGNIKHAFERAAPIVSGEPIEYFKNFCEVLNILLDTGLIVIATVAEITLENLTELEMTIGRSNIATFWLGAPQHSINQKIIYLIANDGIDSLLLQLKLKLGYL